MDQPAAFDQLQRHLQSQVAKPSFDEWYSARHFGRSFEEDHMQFGGDISSSLRALTRLMRDYVTEMVR